MLQEAQTSAKRLEQVWKRLRRPAHRRAEVPSIGWTAEKGREGTERTGLLILMKLCVSSFISIYYTIRCPEVSRFLAGSISALWRAKVALKTILHGCFQLLVSVRIWIAGWWWHLDSVMTPFWYVIGGIGQLDFILSPDLKRLQMDRQGFTLQRSLWPKKLRMWLRWQLHLVGGLEHLDYVPFSWEFHHPNWLWYFSQGWVNHQLGNVGKTMIYYGIINYKTYIYICYYLYSMVNI